MPAASHGPTDGGALGPTLAAALRRHAAALHRLETAEAAVEAARREVSESRARLQALSTGARVTGTRVLVALDEDAGQQPPDGGDDHEGC